ncbi:MAG: hypothetical protein WA709_30950 [Stellaceae bacterium]
MNEAQQDTALLPLDLDQQPGFATEDDNRDSVCVALPVARQLHGSQQTQRWREVDSNFRSRRPRRGPCLNLNGVIRC